MDLLKVLNEEGAGGAVGGGAGGSVSAGAIATAQMPLFSHMVKRNIPSIQQTLQKKKKKTRLGLKEALDGGMENFDQQEVLSKLKSLERKDTLDRTNSVNFGLEDSEGNTVRVTVPAEEAEEFERILAAYLSDDEEREENGDPDIAEVLWALRDRFTIIDVKWPSIPEDEEEAQLAAPKLPDDQAANADNQQAGGEGEDVSAMLDADQAQDTSGDSEDDAKSLLQKVLDMMTSDAEARKAEAEARQKEAEMKADELSTRQAMAKVKQEEMFLDMDEWEKAKKAKQQEIKRLAKLAKWKQDMAKEQGITDEDETEIDFGLEDDAEKQGSEDTSSQEDIATDLDQPDQSQVPSLGKAKEEEEISKKVIYMKNNKASADEIADFIVGRIKK